MKCYFCDNEAKYSIEIIRKNVISRTIYAIDIKSACSDCMPNLETVKGGPEIHFSKISPEIKEEEEEVPDKEISVMMEEVLQSTLERAEMFFDGAGFNFGLTYEKRDSDNEVEETGYSAWVIRRKKRENESYYRYESAVGPEETPILALKMLIAEMDSELK